MKKVLLTLIAMIMFIPVVAFAENKIKVRIPAKDDSAIVTETNEETGIVTKKFPVYVEQTEATEVKSVTINITKRAPGINKISFEAAQPYSSTPDGENKVTFAVAEGVRGAEGTKLMIGYVVLTVNTAADDCSIEYTAKVNGVKTGAFVSYAALGAGVLLVCGIYVATRSKKKMYNI